MNTVRTRFAPSPTGFLHIGGARSAMYAWLFARHHKGQFVLRVEDTDQKRKVEGAVESLIDSFKWLGMDIDEGPSLKELEAIGATWEGAPDFGGEYGPYVQSQRVQRYQEVAEDLVARGIAYRCDCTAERIEAEREEQKEKKEGIGYSGYCRDREVSADSKHVIRLKIPADVSLTLIDGVRGKIHWDSVSLRDPVLLKGDGFPTYHLANVIDDHDMQISHVFRAEEWIPTTPIHILLYQALDWQIPTYFHLSQVLGSDGKKLSKRHGAVSVEKFKEEGYLPQALFNYIVHVGWNPGEGEEQEVFTREELIEKFTVDGLGKSGGVFDETKLQWMNGVYLRNMTSEEFEALVESEIKKSGMEFKPELFKVIAPHVQERCKLVSDLAEMTDYLFKDKIERDLEAMFKKKMTAELAVVVLEKCIEKFESLAGFTKDETENAVRALSEELELKVGPVCMVLRIAVSGKKVSPPLFESMEAFGCQTTVSRLNETLELLKDR